MSENINEMRLRHATEIDNLQRYCVHKEISDWQEYHWAIGHFGGHIKTCLFCGKIMGRKHDSVEHR